MKSKFGEEDHSDDLSQDGSQDEKDMAKLGKKQQFKRHFNFWSILGFACTCMITWEGLFTTFVYGLENGGPAGLVYGFILVWLGYGCVVASLAELMSMWPTSGGQYHWTYTLAPAKVAPFLSYICGWQSVIAWQAAVASTHYLTATILQGIVILNNPSYEPQRWHGTLLMYAVMFIVVFTGTIGNRALPMIDYIILALHVAGFFVVLIVFLVQSPTKASDHDVFEIWLNNGYSSQGLSFLVGLQGLVFAWLGADGAIHMSEEIKNASKVVPWSLMGSIVINGGLGFGAILLVLYYGPTGQDLVDALGTPTGYPFLAIFQYGSGSVRGGVGLAAMVLIVIFAATTMLYVSTTRQLWAFARDNGVPGSRLIARIDKKTQLPLWSCLVTATVTVLLALINIGSSIAFNAILSLTVAGFIGSYVLPIALLLWRRTSAAFGSGTQLPWGPWRMGRAGILVNLIALCWIVVIFIFSFFPVTPLPALTVESMNWSSLGYGAVTILAIAFWLLHGRKSFKGPVRDAAGGEIEPVLGWGQAHA